MGIRKCGRFYQIDYYFKGRRCREIAGETRSEAQEALEARRTDIRRERFDFLVKYSSPRIDQFTEEYMEYAKAHKQSFRRDASMMKNILAFFGSRRLDEITPALVEKYMLRRLNDKIIKGRLVIEKKLKPATVNRELAVLKRMFNLAILWKKAKENPVRAVKFFKEDPFPERILTYEEEERLLRCSSERLRPVVIMALNAGMRYGEIISLKWEFVDLRNRVIRVVKTKNGKMRKIPINSLLLNVLESMPKTGENVFGGEKPYKSIRNSFEKACKDAGIKNLRFHDLRHMFATRMAENNVDLRALQDILGHSSLNMVMRYSHPTAGHKLEAVEKLIRK
jgi:integrase